MKSEKTCWIKSIHENHATGVLKEVYGTVRSPSGTVDNVYRAQSLHPQSIAGHDQLYKAVLHHPDAHLPAWFLEAVAVYTSLLNDCAYAVTHHVANMESLLPPDIRSAIFMEALQSGDLPRAFSPKQIALLEYTAKLTRRPNDISQVDIETLRQAGADDAEILEVNQVCACFNYSNRVLNGLGVTLGDDIIGYYHED